MARIQKWRGVWIAPALLGLALSVAAPHDIIVFNPSASLPSGFYIRWAGPLRRGAIVTVRADAAAPAYARLRNFTGPRHRFIKRVAGLAGDRVCAQDDIVSINAVRRVRRSVRDRAGHALPVWFGCRILGAGEVFLLGDSDDSFDARYWGVLSARLIEARWRPLWTWRTNPS